MRTVLRTPRFRACGSSASVRGHSALSKSLGEEACLNEKGRQIRRKHHILSFGRDSGAIEVQFVEWDSGGPNTMSRLSKCIYLFEPLGRDVCLERASEGHLRRRASSTPRLLGARGSWITLATARVRTTARDTAPRLEKRREPLPSRSLIEVYAPRVLAPYAPRERRGD